MRCTKCNVDLGESYTICPLCGSRAENIEPLIADQRTAEYPTLKPKKHHPDAFAVFLIIWAIISVGTLICYISGVINKNLFGCIVMSVASVWTVFFRPVFVPQLYFGNYLAISALPLSALAVFAEKAFGNGAEVAYLLAVPCIFTLAILIMLVAAVFVKSSGKRAAPYGVLFLLAGLIGAVYCAVTDISCTAWLIEALVSAMTIIATLLIYREKVADELKAKFSE